LEDIELVESLEETKKTATSVTEQVKAARESEVSDQAWKARWFKHSRPKTHVHDPGFDTQDSDLEVRHTIAFGTMNVYTEWDNMVGRSTKVRNHWSG